MTSTGHMSVPQGKKVYRGRHIVAKFKEHKGRYVYFYDHEPISTGLISTLSIYQADNERIPETLPSEKTTPSAGTNDVK